MLQELCQRLEFPREAEETFLSVSALLNEEAMSRAEKLFWEKDETWLTIMEEEAARCGTAKETVTMVLLLRCLPRWKEKYAEAGYPEELFWDNTVDLNCKLRECRDLCGVWGNNAPKWYHELYHLECIKLGRLQYVVSTWKEDDFPPMRTGDRVFKVHIPSSGPLTPESVEESFRIAKEFYTRQGLLETEYFPVMCASWLLYPAHHDLFPEGSNMRAFQDLFTIVSQTERWNDFSRVFNLPYTEDYASLPEDNRLRKNFKQFLLSGGKMGLGRGILFR